MGFRLTIHPYNAKMLELKIEFNANSKLFKRVLKECHFSPMIHG